jgi:hypothetical protein
MVLSNAERQRRYREKREKMAAEGVTPEMVDQVARIVWERARQDEPEAPSWDDVLAGVGTKRGRSVWSAFMRDLGWLVPDEAEATETYGDDSVLVRKVLLVLNAAARPPAERGP